MNLGHVFFISKLKNVLFCLHPVKKDSVQHPWISRVVCLPKVDEMDSPESSLRKPCFPKQAAQNRGEKSISEIKIKYHG